MVAMGTFLFALSSVYLPAAAQAQVTKYEQLMMIHTIFSLETFNFFCFFQPAQFAYLCADSSEGKCAAIPAEMSGDFLTAAAARMRPLLQHTDEESRRASKQLLGARFASYLVSRLASYLRPYILRSISVNQEWAGERGGKFLISGGL